MFLTFLTMVFLVLVAGIVYFFRKWSELSSKAWTTNNEELRELAYLTAWILFALASIGMLFVLLATAGALK